MNDIIKSPMFYMGNKYKLLPQLLAVFPKDIENFYDVFGGSGVVSLNVNATVVNYNELNPNIYNMFRLFKTHTPYKIIEHISCRIKQFDLKRGWKKGEPLEYKKEVTDNYLRFRSFYNEDKQRDYLDLFTLTFFSFSNLIRFNQKEQFNMPVGNQYFNDTHVEIIESACNRINKIRMNLSNENALSVLERHFENNDFVYLDPPYLNTTAVYNEKRAHGGWCIENDYELFEKLDVLTQNGIKWAMSNVFIHKGKVNQHLIDWSKKYNIKLLDKKYSALGKGNANSQEVLITNYKNEVQCSLFEDYIL